MPEMAKATKKSTRKFEKNHLKDVIERRKIGTKIKQRKHIKAKQQERKAKDRDFLGNRESEDDIIAHTKANGSDKRDAFGEMSVDDFFQSGFKIPEGHFPKSSKS